MRKLLETSKGCHITPLYLTLGQFPARFAIQKMKLLFIKYILHEDDNSMINTIITSSETPYKSGLGITVHCRFKSDRNN